MDNPNLKIVEANMNAAVDVSNSTNLQDSNNQGTVITPVEGNNFKNQEAVISNNRTENTTDDMQTNKITTDSINSCDNSVNNLALPHTSSFSVVTGLASKSLLDILTYGSGSSSEDSEADSVDLIQDSKSSDSDDSDWEDIPSDNNINDVRSYRNVPRSSESTSDSNESLDETEVGAIGAVKPVSKKIRTDEDLELDQLPPVPDLSKLSISVKTEDCIQIGKISNVIDRLVTIESLPNTPAYDLETLFFLDKGKVPLGYVHDVIGQVTSPIYVVRFNSRDEIESKGITRGLPVYCAPNTVHTQFVFLKELLKMKGSDASWQGDNEVPLEFLDFSDDEFEFGHCIPSNSNEMNVHARKKKRNSLDRHKIFETAMNLRNEVDSARFKVQDGLEPPPKSEMLKRSVKLHYHQPPIPCNVRPAFNQGFNSYCSPNFTMPPNFNMINIPPPIFNVTRPPYPMVHFPPNAQFPPPTFGSPAIPPLPHLAHISVPPPPPPPGYHPVSLPMLPTPMPLAVCKPIPQIQKMHQNTGVVPKMRLPSKYTSPGELHFINNPGARREIDLVNTVRPNLASGLGSLPYSPMMNPYNKTSSNNTRGHFKNP